VTPASDAASEVIGLQRVKRDCAALSFHFRARSFHFGASSFLIPEDRQSIPRSRLVVRGHHLGAS
jgi:hypothetical protein